MAPQAYVRDVVERQEELNIFCKQTTQQAQVIKKVSKKNSSRRSMLKSRPYLGIPECDPI